MNPRQVLDEFRAVLDGVAARDSQVKYDMEVFASNVPATVTKPDNYLIQASLKAREVVLGERQEKFPLGQATPSNDSNIFRQHGIPAVKCGPSGGKVPPNAEFLLNEGERLSIEELVAAAKIYVALALDICTKTRKEINES